MLGNPSAAGSPAASAFSLTMSNHSINMTATVVSQSSLAGDSIGDQIYALTHSSTSTKKHLGAILGSSIGSAVALLLLLATAVAFGRDWLKQRRLQKQAAALHKVNLPCCCACCTRCSVPLTPSCYKHDLSSLSATAGAVPALHRGCCSAAHAQLAR